MRAITKRVVAWLCCLVLRHWWADTAWNIFGTAVEQKCRVCGACRHHYFEHLRGYLQEPDWQPGPHVGCAKTGIDRVSASQRTPRREYADKPKQKGDAK